MNELPLIIIIGSMGMSVCISLFSVGKALLSIRNEIVRLTVSIDRMKVAIEQQGDFKRNILSH